jgi:signal transduction histidine kinase
VVARAILRHRQKDPAEGARAPSRSRLEPVLQSARAAWHEVNNPLFAIEGSVQLLLATGCVDDEAHRVHLDRIQRACERIRAAMQQLREETLTALRALEGEGTPLDFRDHLPPVSYDP